MSSRLNLERQDAGSPKDGRGPGQHRADPSGFRAWLARLVYRATHWSVKP